MLKLKGVVFRPSLIEARSHGRWINAERRKAKGIEAEEAAIAGASGVQSEIGKVNEYQEISCWMPAIDSSLLCSQPSL
jgi:hypothetical protein